MMLLKLFLIYLHQIMLLEKMPIAEFIDVETDLKRMIEKDSRGELSQKALFKNNSGTCNRHICIDHTYRSFLHRIGNV